MRAVAPRLARAAPAAAPQHGLPGLQLDYEAVERVRRTERSSFRDEEGFSLTYLPFVSRAVVDALAGLRANEARYFKNKFDHTFVTQPASKAKKTIAYVHRILKDERDIEIGSPVLEASEFEVDGTRYVLVDTAGLRDTTDEIERVTVGSVAAGWNRVARGVSPCGSGVQ